MCFATSPLLRWQSPVRAVCLKYLLPCTIVFLIVVKPMWSRCVWHPGSNSSDQCVVHTRRARVLHHFLLQHCPVQAQCYSFCISTVYTLQDVPEGASQHLHQPVNLLSTQLQHQLQRRSTTSASSIARNKGMQLPPLFPFSRRFCMIRAHVCQKSNTPLAKVPILLSLISTQRRRPMT